MIHKSPEIRAGTVWVNCHNVDRCRTALRRFQGVGLGPENGMEAVRAYTETQTIVIPLAVISPARATPRCGCTRRLVFRSGPAMPPVSPTAQVDYDQAMAAGIFPLTLQLLTPVVPSGSCSPACRSKHREFVLLLHGPHHTGAVLEDALAQHPTGVFGCSTSGKSSPAATAKIRYLPSALIAATSAVCHAGSTRWASLASNRPGPVLSMQWELRKKSPGSNASNTFALLLIDSLSQAEEFVAAALGNELGTIHLVEGRAGITGNCSEPRCCMTDAILTTVRRFYWSTRHPGFQAL